MSLENSPKFLLNFSEVEMRSKDKHFYCFKSFRLDVAERLLLHGESPVSLTPKAFDVLAVLVERSGHLVTKDELLKLVWSDSVVEEANIARVIHTLRKALNEDENGNKFIETVAKKGYRFVAEIDKIVEPFESENNNGNGSSSNTEDPVKTEIKPETGANNEPVPLRKIKHGLWTPPVIFGTGLAGIILLVSLWAIYRYIHPPVNPNEIKSIAVLPFKSLTSENRDAIYELGMADSLILKLSQAKNLVVRPLNATRKYAELDKDAADVGNEQKVDYVLTSNYQIVEGKIKITSQLVDVAAGTVEEVFINEQDISNPFAAQNKVAANLGQALLKRLNRQTNKIAAKSYTTNEEAYRLYLQAAVLVDKRTAKEAQKAVEYLEQAVRLDPNYALAYARLADAYGAIGLSGGDKTVYYLKEKDAIEKALAIDENLAEAYSQSGEIKLNFEWDFAGAEIAHKRALELNPNSAAAHREYAIYLNSLGRFEEAINEIKSAIDFEPASGLNLRVYGMILYYARRYDEAVLHLERTIEMDVNNRQAYGWLISAYRMKGDDDKAFEWFLRSPRVKQDETTNLQSWKDIYAKTGWRGINLRLIELAKETEKEGKTPYWELSNLYGEIGDRENALAYIEKGLPGRGWGWTVIKISPSYDALRSDPRFENLIRRVGLN